MTVNHLVYTVGYCIPCHALVSDSSSSAMRCGYQMGACPWLAHSVTTQLTLEPQVGAVIQFRRAELTVR
jgi:hypothetical protein